MLNLEAANGKFPIAHNLLDLSAFNYTISTKNIRKMIILMAVFFSTYFINIGSYAAINTSVPTSFRRKLAK